MAVGSLSYGAVDTGDGTSSSAAIPSGNAGDLLLFWVATGETSDTTPTCSTTGFSQAATVLAGSGTFGNNAGRRRLTLFVKEATDAFSGTATATIGGSSANRAIMGVVGRVSKDSAETWAITHATANKTSASSSLSVATSPTLDFDAGDGVVLAATSAFDAVSWSSEAVSATGATFSGLTERKEDATTSGFDAKLVIADGSVTAGPATGATTATATFSASATAGVIVTRLSVTTGSSPSEGTASGGISWAGSSTGRAILAGLAAGAIALAGAATGSAPVIGPNSGSATGSISWAGTATGARDSSGTATGATTWAGSATGTSGSPIRLLEVVGSISGLASDESGQAIYDRYSTRTVLTLHEAGTAAPDLADFDLVWITNSCPLATTMTDYDAASIPVIATGVRSPHSGYSSANATNGSSQTTVYLKTAGVGDPTVPADLTAAGDVTVLDSAFTARYTTNTQLGSGRHEIAATDSGNLSHLCFTRYDSGGAMSTGTAPSRRAWFLLHPGSIGTSRGWDFLDLLVDWATAAVPDGAATGAISWAGSASGARASAGSASGGLALSGTATGATSPAGTATGALALAGTATGSTVHAGTATGELTLTGSAVGEHAAQGTGSGAVTWGGTASGEAPVVGGASGSAAGALGWAGSATGAKAPAGTAAGTLTLTGSAGGFAPSVDGASGIAVGAIGWAGTAVGAAQPQGAATGALNLAGSASGTRDSAGTATGTLAWSGTASGRANPGQQPVADPRLTLHLPASTLTLALPASRLTLTLPDSRLEIT